MIDRTSCSEKVADANIRKWLLMSRASEMLPSVTPEKRKENVGPYLVIARETGSGGSEIARSTASKLGWDVLDHEIIDCMSEKYGIPPDLVELIDQQRADWIEDMFTNWIMGRNFTKSTYLIRLSRLLSLAAHHGKVVIVGRAAQFILPRERGLSVRILAPLELRIEHVVQRQGISQHEAHILIEDADRQHREFAKRHFHHDSADPHMYDLVINVEKLAAVDAADLISDAVRCWVKKSGIVG